MEVGPDVLIKDVEVEVEGSSCLELVVPPAKELEEDDQEGSVVPFSPVAGDADAISSLEDVESEDETRSTRAFLSFSGNFVRSTLSSGGVVVFVDRTGLGSGIVL